MARAARCDRCSPHPASNRAPAIQTIERCIIHPPASFRLIYDQVGSELAFKALRHSSCLESLYIFSLYYELSAAVQGEWGAQINDSREPGCLPAANGSQSKGGSLPHPGGMRLPPRTGRLLPSAGEQLLRTQTNAFLCKNHQFMNKNMIPLWTGRLLSSIFAFYHHFFIGLQQKLIKSSLISII